MARARWWVLAVPVAALVAGCGGSTVRYTSSSTTTAKKHESTTSTTRAPFVAKAEGFQAVFPATPKRQEQPVEQTGVKLTVVFYLATTNDIVTGIGVSDMPVAIPAENLQATLDASIDGTAKKVNGQVRSRSTVDYLSTKAEDATVTTQGLFLRERVVLLGRRMYIFEGLTQSASDDHSDYDTLLSSFKPI